MNLFTINLKLTIMKKLILLLPLVVSINCFSQIKKPITNGNWIIDGGGSIQTEKDQYISGTTKSKTNVFFITLNPGFGYFVIDNLAVGANTMIFINGTKNNKYYTLGIGPMARYYFDNGLLLKADASFSFLHNLSSSASNETFFSLIPGAGYAFFLNQKVSIEPCLCYEFDKIRYNSTNNHRSNSVRLEVKLSIFL